MSRIPERTALTSPVSIPEQLRISMSLFLTESNLALAFGLMMFRTVQWISRPQIAALLFLASPMKTPITRSPSKLLISPPCFSINLVEQSKNALMIFAVVDQGHMDDNFAEPARSVYKNVASILTAPSFNATSAVVGTTRPSRSLKAVLNNVSTRPFRNSSFTATVLFLTAPREILQRPPADATPEVATIRTKHHRPVGGGCVATFGKDRLSAMGRSSLRKGAVSRPSVEMGLPGEGEGGAFEDPAWSASLDLAVQVMHRCLLRGFALRAIRVDQG